MVFFSAVRKYFDGDSQPDNEVEQDRFQADKYPLIAWLKRGEDTTIAGGIGISGLRNQEPRTTIDMIAIENPSWLPSPSQRRLHPKTLLPEATALSLFTEDSPFVLRDSRRTRPLLPTTAQGLNHKHDLLLPRHVVDGKTVLDLGCCLGATGYWVVKHGASRYLGLELQDGFAQIGRELLMDIPQAAVETRDTLAYLEQPDEQFDVVCVLGLVHGLYDPLAVIRQAAACTRTYLCFEDFGPDHPEAVMLPDHGMRMPQAGVEGGTRGFGWMISPKAMHSIMDFLGFAPDMDALFLTEGRWLCRYVRQRDEAKSASYSDEKISWT